MSTQAQTAANRKNAQKSTGPKTPEGRDAVRLNGLKHGLASEILVLPGESVSDFEDLLDSLQAEQQPSTPTELILVRQMAMAAMELSRKAVTKHWWVMFCLLVVIALISLVGLLACCVGLIAALPIGLGALMYAYEDIFAGPGSASP